MALAAAGAYGVGWGENRNWRELGGGVWVRQVANSSFTSPATMPGTAGCHLTQRRAEEWGKPGPAAFLADVERESPAPGGKVGDPIQMGTRGPVWGACLRLGEVLGLWAETQRLTGVPPTLGFQ